MNKQDKPSPSERSLSDKAGDLLIYFFLSTDTIRAMPRMMLVQRVAANPASDGEISRIEAVRKRFTEELCFSRRLRSSESGILFNSKGDFLAVSKAVERSVTFSEISNGRIVASAANEEGRRLVREAKFGQRTIQEMGNLADRSLLFLLASAAEVFAGRLLRLHYREHPGALSGQVISIDRLREFDNFQGAIDHAADEKIESIIRHPASSWFTQVLEVLSIPIDPVKDLVAPFDEAFARRNALIHNGGEVGGQYLARCAAFARENNIVRGNILHTDPIYINKTIDTFVSVMGYAGYAFLQKIDKKQRSLRCDIFNHQVIKELECDRFDLAARLCSVIEQDPLCDASSKLTSVVNRAQALKWSGKNPEAISLLNMHDWETREDRFKLANLVIRDEFDDARVVAERCVNSGQLTTDDLASWPLFRECRKRGLFDDLLNEVSGPVYDSSDGPSDGG